MTSSLPGVNEELAAAIRRVNALRSSLPSLQRPAFDERGWVNLLGRIERARTADRALRAIEQREHDASVALSHRLLNAPLDREPA